MNPYIKITTHVSVNSDPPPIRKNVDAQRWDECGPFWSPPDPNNPSQTLDGAYFTPNTWSTTTPCGTPPGPFPADTAAPPPGTMYGINYLFERFFSPLASSTAAFNNLLAIWVFSTTTLGADGANHDAQHLDYRLAGCGNDKFKGGLGGSLGGADMSTVLDSGSIEVWFEGGRTHVAAVKIFELSDAIVDWMTQLDPAFHELNDELGELACCLH